MSKGLVIIFITLLSLNLYSESRLRIAVIDTGVSREIADKSYMCQDNPIIEPEVPDHGTNIVGLIGDRINSKKYCVYIFPLGNPVSGTRYIQSLRHIARNPEKYAGLNISLASDKPDAYETFDKYEKMYLTDIAKTVKIVVAAGNGRYKLDVGCKIFPACHRESIKVNMFVIGNSKSKMSNYGPLVDKMIDGDMQGSPAMSGSSQSTAIFTGSLFAE